MSTRWPLLWLTSLLAATTLAPSCQPPNPIVEENRRAGTTDWQLSQPGDDSALQIKAFADTTSIDQGGTVDLFVTVTPAQTFTVDVYRLGFYGGAGGRFVASFGPFAGVTQPACTADARGRIECPWSVSATLAAGADWTTGVYLAKLTNAAGFQNYATFAVRDDGRTGHFLYQQSVSTYHAYNNFPDDGVTGKSLYEFNSYGSNTAAGTPRALEVSLDRPYPNQGAGQVFAWEHALIQWLEQYGYDLNYATNLDTHTDGARLLDFRAFLSTGHDEYWSREMYDAVDDARAAGVHLAFFGSNAAYWQVRLEPASDGRPNRTMVGTKNASLDPHPDPYAQTILWRQVGRPEQGLIGVQYGVCCGPGNTDHVVLNSDHWVYEPSGFIDADTVPGIVGYEIDHHHPGTAKPPHLSYTLLSASPYVPSNGQTHIANAVIYQAPSGSWVFGAGTMSWSWALADTGAVDARIQRTTQYLLARFLEPPDAVQPGPGLVGAWDFESTSWGGNAGEVLDAGPLGLDGTAFGGAQPSGGAGCGVARFAGAGQRIDVPYHPEPNASEFSVALWARVDGSPGTWRSPLTSRWSGGSGGGIGGFNLYAGTNDLWQFWTGDPSGGGWSILTGPAVSIGSWTHVAATFESTGRTGWIESGTKSLYVNGALVAQTAEDFQPNSDAALHLGAGTSSGSDYWFDGALDGVRIFNRALAPAEIDALRVATLPCGVLP